MSDELDELQEIESMPIDDDGNVLEKSEADTRVKWDIPESDPSRHYVDKEKLYKCYVDWYAECALAKENGQERPDPPRYLSESVLKICYRLASRWNFAGYPFRDEMVGDAIENIFRYIDRFDIVNYNNPFAYLTRIAYFAFVRRITEEKKKAAVKQQLILNSGILDTLSAQGYDSSSEDYHHIVEQVQMKVDVSLADFNPSKKKVKKALSKKQSNSDVESFLE